jgi:L-lysine exporter family protein LysE/ArgO
MRPMPALTIYLQGLAICAALIVAIGAQNAFVLRQGIRGEHIGAVVVFCAVADAVLIAAGVLGIGQLLQRWPGLADGLALGGAAFLAAYGALALRRALDPVALTQAGAGTPPRRHTVLAQAAAFTLLNPHVYLDTVLLVGTVGSQHPAAMRPWFIAGGASASALWFAGLGYGARRLAPWLGRPAVWRWVEAVIGGVMWALAASLVAHVVA